MTTEAVTSVSNYIELPPILRSMSLNNDKRPKNSLPIDTHGTVQSNNDDALPQITLYNAHGILKKTNPNSLIGYA
jgi:hypothetical protein